MGGERPYYPLPTYYLHVMVTLIAGSLLMGIVIVALYFFGAFKSPYLGLPYFWLFRFAFMLLLMLLMATLWYGGRETP